MKKNCLLSALTGILFCLAPLHLLATVKLVVSPNVYIRLSYNGAPAQRTGHLWEATDLAGNKFVPFDSNTAPDYFGEDDEQIDFYFGNSLIGSIEGQKAQKILRIMREGRLQSGFHCLDFIHFCEGSFGDGALNARLRAHDTFCLVEKVGDAWEFADSTDLGDDLLPIVKVSSGHFAMFIGKSREKRMFLSLYGPGKKGSMGATLVISTVAMINNFWKTDVAFNY